MPVPKETAATFGISKGLFASAIFARPQQQIDRAVAAHRVGLLRVGQALKHGQCRVDLFLNDEDPRALIVDIERLAEEEAARVPGTSVEGPQVTGMRTTFRTPEERMA